MQFRMSQMESSNPGVRLPWGDHAMLSAKPIMGYKCMACDRPLDKLDKSPGPYLPTHQLKTLGRVSPESRSDGENSRQPSPCTPEMERRGPQHWYNDAFGPPAENLRKADVGPHLPPGGWKGQGKHMTPLVSRTIKLPRDYLPRIGTPKLHQQCLSEEKGL